MVVSSAYRSRSASSVGTCSGRSLMQIMNNRGQECSPVGHHAKHSTSQKLYLQLIHPRLPSKYETNH